MPKRIVKKITISKKTGMPIVHSIPYIEMIVIENDL